MLVQFFRLDNVSFKETPFVPLLACSPSPCASFHHFNPLQKPNRDVDIVGRYNDSFSRNLFSGKYTETVNEVPREEWLVTTQLLSYYEDKQEKESSWLLKVW